MSSANETRAKPTPESPEEAARRAAEEAAAAEARALEKLARARSILGSRLADLDLLRRALTHSSAKAPGKPSYERLEFLGDAILQLVVSQHLYETFPESTEGALTRLRAVLVSSRTLVHPIRRLGLDACLIVSRGLEGTTPSRALCADLFEAIAAALYLDAGFEAARRWILEVLAPHIAETRRTLEDYNWKSRLQQFTQRELGGLPSYILERTSGPDHKPRFHVRVSLGEETLGRGDGATKKAAEQAAAQAACESLIADEGSTRIDTSPDPLSEDEA